MTKPRLTSDRAFPFMVTPKIEGRMTWLYDEDVDTLRIEIDYRFGQDTRTCTSAEAVALRNLLNDWYDKWDT